MMRHLSTLPFRGLLIAVAVCALAVTLTLDTGRTPSADATHNGTVQPSPGTQVVIQGHRFNIPVKFTTCTTPTNSYCRLGAYAVKLEYDTTKVSLRSTTGTSTGGNTSTTFKDTTKIWKTNEWRDSRVTLTGGAGYYGNDGNIQSRIVVSNTADTLTVTPAWHPAPALLPNATSSYTLGGMTDGGWLGSTGRPVACPVGGQYGANWAELHCVTLGSQPLGPTGAGNLTVLSMTATSTGTGVFTLRLLTPGSQVLRIDGLTIAADLLNGTRRVIVCPDATGDGRINVIDLSLIAAVLGARVGPPATGGYVSVRDVDLNGTINVVDLSLAAAVLGLRCVQL